MTMISEAARLQAEMELNHQRAGLDARLWAEKNGAENVYGSAISPTPAHVIQAARQNDRDFVVNRRNVQKRIKEALEAGKTWVTIKGRVICW